RRRRAAHFAATGRGAAAACGLPRRDEHGDIGAATHVHHRVSAGDAARPQTMRLRTADCGEQSKSAIQELTAETAEDAEKRYALRALRSRRLRGQFCNVLQIAFPSPAFESLRPP